MINSLQFLLNGQEIQPMNRAAFSLDFSVGNFTMEGVYIFAPMPRLAENKLVIEGEAKDIVHAWFRAGNIFEGIPCKVIHRETGTEVFDGYGDVGNSATSIYCDEVTLILVDRRVNFLTRIEALNLKALREPKIRIITEQDYIRINYVINSVPNYTQTVLLAISLYQVVSEFIQWFKETQKDVAELANVAPGSAAVLLAKIGIQIFFLSLLVVQIYQLLDAISDNIFPKPRYYFGIREKLLLEKSCEYLGLELHTSLFNGKDQYNTILPDKNIKGNLVGTANTNDDDGLPNMTFADFLNDICQRYNARAIIIGNKIFVEHWTYFLKPCNVRLPRLKNFLGVATNASELEANITIKFQKDAVDTNTYDNQKGYFVQSYISPKAIGNVRNQTLKGLNQITSKYSKGHRKDSQGTAEKVLASIFDFASRLTKRGGQLRGNRIGCLKLHGDFVGVPKLLSVGDDGMLLSDNEDTINARRYYDEYYKDSSTAITNQWLILDGELDYCLSVEELQALRENPVCTAEVFVADKNGTRYEERTVVVQSLELNNDTGLYRVKLRYQSTWTENLVEEVSERE